ncbi:MAG TPA: hypothetical protein VF439_00775 [Candidatus Paceibacterota bacterium]
MPLKDRDERKRYHAAYMKEVWYPKNRKKHLEYVKRNKRRVAAFLEEYKRNGTCTDCGFKGRDFPSVLDFDHTGSGTKKFNVGSWSQSVLSIETVKKEIEKCELVCANCHRIRTSVRAKKRSR